MGYEVHITRQENWFDEDTHKMISLEEWQQLLAEDPEMRLDNFAKATTSNGEFIRMESEGLAVWTKYPGNGIEGNFAWFYYDNGNIVCKNPDEELMNKLLFIANRLGAKVQGDDGEWYEVSTSGLKQQDNKPTPRKKNWWKFW